MLKSKKALKDEVLVLKRRLDELTRYCTTNPTLAEQARQRDQLEKAIAQRDYWWKKCNKLRYDVNDIFCYIQDNTPDFSGKEELIGMLVKLKKEDPFE